MPSEEEILKYTLDLSDVEAKAARLIELLEQIKAKRAAGGDASELEAQVSKELDGLGKLAEKAKETAGATEELLKQKHKLAAVMRTLGSDSSALVGDLGGVIELLMQGGKSAITFGGALAGISAAVIVYQKLRDAIREAVEEQERLNQKVLEGTLAAVERGGPLAAELLALGAIERFEEAVPMFDALRKTYGFKPGEAARPTALATMAGLTGRQAGIMQIAMGMEGGPQIATAEQAQEYFAQMPPDVAAALGQQLDDYAKLQQQRLEAGVAQGEIPTGARLTPIQALHEKFKRLGVLGLGADEDVESVEDLQRKVEEAERYRAAVERVRQRRDRGFFTEAGVGLAISQLDLRMGGPSQLRLLHQLEQAETSGAAPADMERAPEAGGGTPAVVNNYNINHNERVGTMYKLPNPLTRNAHWGLGVEVNAGNSVRSKHGY